MSLQQWPLTEKTVRFRRRIIDHLWGDHGAYIDADTFVGTCPVCSGYVTVAFAGSAPRASATCHRGCAEHEIGAALGLGVQP